MFNIYIDDLIKSLQSRALGCYIGMEFYGCIVYADDILLMLASVMQVGRLTDELKKVRTELDTLTQLSQPADRSILLPDAQWPVLPATTAPTTSSHASAHDGKTFAAYAHDLLAKPDSFKNVVRNRKPRSTPKPIVGKAPDAKLKSVVTTRSVDLFVSRLHPATTNTEIKDCVESMAVANDISSSDLECVKLKSKYEGLYASFYVSLRVDAATLSRALEVFMNAEFWPQGVFVKRYFKPKNGAAQ